MERIAQKAAEEIREIPEAERQKDAPAIDDDWMMRFVGKAQEIKNEEMQRMWARVVSGEVRKPGTYSLRALDCLSNITQKDALLFEKAVSLSTVGPGGGRIFKLGDDTALPQFGLDYDKLLDLRSAGLLHDGDTLFVTYNMDKAPNAPVVCFYHNALLQFFNFARNPLKFQCLMLTAVGRELAQIVPPTTDMAYVGALAEQRAKNGFVTILQDLKSGVVTNFNPE